MLKNHQQLAGHIYHKRQSFRQSGFSNQGLNAQSQRATVVLIHGLFGSLENLGAQARALAEHFDVFSIDLPNHGRSYQTDHMNLDSMAQDVISWMDEQSIDSAFLVGHSLGGKVAMEVALKAPKKCKKLVVLDIAPVDYEPRHGRVFKGLLGLDLLELSSRSKADAQLSIEVQEPAVRSFLLKNLVKESDGFRWRMNLPAISACYKYLIAGNRIPDQPVNQPVLFIKGGDSDYMLEAHRDAINARFLNTKLRIIANTGHWLHAEKPQQVATLITHFLIG